MSFLSRGSRFLLDKLPDDYVYLKNNGAKIRSFEGVVDPRCWSCSAVLRHQHLIDLMSEKRSRQPSDPDAGETFGEEIVSKDTSRKKTISESSESSCTCMEGDSFQKPSTLFIEILPRGNDRGTSIEISLPNDDDNTQQLIQENRKLRLKLERARKQEQDYLSRLEKLRNELAKINF